MGAGLFPSVWRLGALYVLVYPVVLISRPACAEPEIISARESDARNRRCAGNNRLGYCPYSERCSSSQMEKALGAKGAQSEKWPDYVRKWDHLERTGPSR